MAQATGKATNKFFLLKSFNLLFFAAFASIMPFLALYYEDLGLSGPQIGALTAIPPLMMVVGASAWGAIADMTAQHRRILGLSILGSILFGYLISSAAQFQKLLPIVALYAFFISPVIPLLDNSVLVALGKRSDQYGKIRLWGAVGWGVAAPIIGAVIERMGFRWSFAIYAVLMIGGLLVALYMPIAKTGIGSRFSQGLRILLQDAQIKRFLFTMLLVGMGLALIDIYLFLHLQSIGANKVLMGLTLTVGTVSEIVIFIFSDRLLNRWGKKRVLIGGILALALQLGSFSMLKVPTLAPLIQILHGPAFAGMWSAGVAIANDHAPEGMGATAQGLLSSLLLGVGGSVGALVGGYLFGALGTELMLRLGAIWILGSALYYAIAGKDLQRA